MSTFTNVFQEESDFLCSHTSGEIYLSEHEDSAWITKNEFKNYNFAEGDSDIIKLL